MNMELDIENKQSQERSAERHTYSMNPSLNKRIKSKKIEDLRLQAVNNVKKSLNML